MCYSLALQGSVLKIDSDAQLSMHFVTCQDFIKAINGVLRIHQTVNFIPVALSCPDLSAINWYNQTETYSYIESV